MKRKFEEAGKRAFAVFLAVVMLVTLISVDRVATAAGSEPASQKELADSLVSFALSKVGKSYVSGGWSDAAGYDCCGLIRAALLNAGMKSIRYTNASGKMTTADINGYTLGADQGTANWAEILQAAVKYTEYKWRTLT